MAKGRLNRKQIRNARRRAEEVHGFAAATQVRVLAEQLPNQAALDTVLKQEKDSAKREAIFNFMKPFIKFSNPQMPNESGIIRPGGLILRP